MEAVHWLLVVAANWDGGKQPRQDNYKRDDGIDQDDQDEQNQTENHKPWKLKEKEQSYVFTVDGWWRPCYVQKLAGGIVMLLKFLSVVLFGALWTMHCRLV